MAPSPAGMDPIGPDANQRVGDGIYDHRDGDCNANPHGVDTDNLLVVKKKGDAPCHVQKRTSRFANPEGQHRWDG